jgi:PAS domain S-box-containing protein
MYIKKTLEFIAQKGYVNYNLNFLKSCTKFLAELLHVDYVLISKYSTKRPTIAEIVSLYGNGKLVKNKAYELKGTPCNNVINKEVYVYKKNVQTIFPEDKFLVQMNADSYIGMPLWTSSGEPIGLIAIIDKNAITNSKTIEKILQIIAIKVEKILEKAQYEKIIKLKIDELKVSKQIAKDNEEKFKNLSNLSFEGIMVHKEGILIDANQAIVNMFGYAKKQLLKKNVLPLLFSEEDQIKLKKNIHKNYILPYEIKGIKKDGTCFPVEIEARTINFGLNEGCRVTSIRDLTNRKKAQSQINKLSTAVDQSANVIFITDINGGIEYVNSKFSEVTGYTFKEVKGKNPRFLKSGKQPKEFYKNLWNTISLGNTWKGTFLNKTKDGKIYWEETTITPIKNSKEKVVNYLAVKEDITQRVKSETKIKEAYQTIKEKEQYLSKILRTAEEGFWVIDTLGYTMTVNLKMCKILGYAKRDVIGKSIFNFVDTTNENIFKEQLKKREKGLATSYEIELLRKTKNNIPCLFKTAPLFNNEHEIIGSFAMVTDISNLKNSYKELENRNKELEQLSNELSKKNRLYLESNYRFRNLFEQSPIALFEEDYREAKELLIKKKTQVKDLRTYLDKNPDFVKECISKI